MKKKIILIFVIVAVFLTVGILFFINHNMVSNKIVAYCNKTGVTNFEINLSDFTDFEWDSVIIYRNPITTDKLNRITGINYEKELDLSSGIIFVQGNKIVYEEVFKTDFESACKFIIYPYEDINSFVKVNSFTKENAVFNCEKLEQYSDCRLVLKPLSQKNNLALSRKELENMAFDYFCNHNSDLLPLEEYHIDATEDVIEEYKNMDMVTIEIRHVNGAISTCDARYFINVYTGKGFDFGDNEIDFTAKG